MIRAIVYLIEIFICFILQTSVFSYFSLSGVVPDCILILVISVAYMGGQNKAIIVGFLSGLLLDIMSGGIIGLCPLIYMGVAYLAGYSNKVFDAHDYIIPNALVFVGEVVYSVAYYCGTFLLMGKTGLFGYMANTIIPRVIYTLIVGLFMYPLFLLLEKLISFTGGVADDN
ncbi:MAG: rod shape-determining protein MreD [Lachnospiraceae bacterium]|nr:rod shape-determining protein MreD [Lachnospiraceae bacterium]